MKFARHEVALNRGNQEAALIKLDIIDEVVNRTGITKTKAEMAVETVFESMKRSRSGHAGFAGLWRRKWRHRTSEISAMPIGMPGWPDFAFSTASMARTRMALTTSCEEGDCGVSGIEFRFRSKGAPRR